MSRVVAVANQKGGVAKTTSVVSLGAVFQARGLRVLLVDLDPQSSLTFSLGIDPDGVESSVADVLVADPETGAGLGIGLEETMRTSPEGLTVVPATVDLAGVEAMLLPVADREFVLRRALEPVLSRYDVVLLDCSPSLGLLTLNALAAADEVIVPLQCEMLSHRGVGQLLDTVDDVRRLLNPRLIVRGLLPTMYDSRSVHSRAVLADVRKRFDVPVLPAVARSVRFPEAPGLGVSILRTSPGSAGATAYLKVADLLLKAWKVAEPGPRRNEAPAGRRRAGNARGGGPRTAASPAAARSAATGPAPARKTAPGRAPRTGSA